METQLKQLLEEVRKHFARSHKFVRIALPGRMVELRADHISMIQRTGTGTTFFLMMSNGHRIEFTAAESDAAIKALSEAGLASE